MSTITIHCTPLSVKKISRIAPFGFLGPRESRRSANRYTWNLTACYTRCTHHQKRRTLPSRNGIHIGFGTCDKRRCSIVIYHRRCFITVVCWTRGRSRRTRGIPQVVDAARRLSTSAFRVNVQDGHTYTHTRTQVVDARFPHRCVVEWRRAAWLLEQSRCDCLFGLATESGERGEESHLLVPPPTGWVPAHRTLLLLSCPVFNLLLLHRTPSFRLSVEHIAFRRFYTLRTYGTVSLLQRGPRSAECLPSV